MAVMEDRTKLRIYGRKPRTPLEENAARVHASQPKPLAAVYLPIVFVLKSKKRVTHPEPREPLCACPMCMEWHEYNFERFRRALLSEFPVACESSVVYDRIEMWEAWTCGFWPHRDPANWGKIRESVEEAQANLDVTAWFVKLDKIERLKIVKQSRQYGCEAHSRKKLLRKVMKDAEQFGRSSESAYL